MKSFFQRIFQSPEQKKAEREMQQKQADLEAWLTQLDSPDVDRRVEAARKLGETGEAHIVFSTIAEDALLQAIQNESWRYFEEERRDPRWDEVTGQQYWVTVQYRGYDRTVQAAIDALGKLRSQKAIPVFLALEQDKSLWVTRSHFIDAVANIGGDAAVKILLEEYQKAPYGVQRDRLVRMLLQNGWRPTDPDEIVRIAIMNGDISSLERSGPEVLDAVLKVYSTFNESDRWKIVELAARFKDPRALRLAQDLLAEAEAHFKTMSIRSLNSGLSMDTDKGLYMEKCIKAAQILLDMDRPVATSIVRRAIEACPVYVSANLIDAAAKTNDLGLIDDLYRLLESRRYEPPIATSVKLTRNPAFIAAFKRHPNFQRLSSYEQSSLNNP